MKLYTEEQVKGIYEKGVYDGSIGLEHDIENITCYYQPIELPSDEEIEKASFGFSDALFNKDECFVIGAKWMKEQILNQNK